MDLASRVDTKMHELLQSYFLGDRYARNATEPNWQLLCPNVAMGFLTQLDRDMKGNAGVSCEDELKKIKVSFQAGRPETTAKYILEI